MALARISRTDVSWCAIHRSVSHPSTREVSKPNVQLRVINTDFAHANGLGAINKQDLENQADQVAAAFALKTKPNADQIFNSSFLPPKSERIPRTPPIK